jgi:hypothetical protein
MRAKRSFNPNSMQQTLREVKRNPSPAKRTDNGLFAEQRATLSMVIASARNAGAKQSVYNRRV